MMKVSTVKSIRQWFALLLGIFFFFPPSLYSQIRWERTNGPYGGTVRALAVDHALGIVYASTYGNGVFKTIDQATNWQPANADLDGAFVRSLAVDPSTGILYAGTERWGILVSYDQGTSWSKIPSTEFDPLIVQAILIYSSGMLFAGTTNGIYRSIDNGITWIPMNAGLTNLTVYSLAQTRTGIIIAGTSKGAFRSSDFGETWYPSGNTLSGKTCYSIALDPALEIIYLGASDGVYQSSDNGATWIPTGLMSAANNSIFAVTISQVDGTIYAGSDFGGVYKSIDGGGNWNPINTGLSSRRVRSLAVDHTGAVYAGFLGCGVYRSMDNGMSWTEQNNGLTGTTIFSLKPHPIAGLLAGTQYNGMFHTTDYGKNWFHIGNEILTAAITSIFVHPNRTIFAGAGNGIYSSTDNGDTWSSSSNGLPTDGYSIYSIIMNTNGEMFANSVGGIYRSIDTGQTWTPISSTLPAGYIYSLTVTPTGTLFTIIDTLGIYKSTNDGTSWSRVGTGLTTKNLWTISSIPLTAPSYALLTGTDIGIFRSTDNGDTWDQKMSGQDINIFDIGPHGIVFCGTSTDGVYISDNNGVDWYRTDQDLSSRYILSFGFTSKGLIYAGGNGSGVWRGIPTFPMIAVPSQVQFQNITVGQSDTQFPTIQNVGGESLHIDSIRIEGTNGNDFSVTNTASSIVLQQDETKTLTVQFTPGAAGVRVANLLIYSDDPYLEIATIPLRGIGIKGPQIAVNDTIAFGVVNIDSSADKEFVIQNIGSGILRIDSMRVQMTAGAASEYQFVNVIYPITLISGATQGITLRWSPVSPGPRSGVMIIYSNDQTQSAAQVVINGTAVPGCVITLPDTLSFGTEGVGFSVDKLVSIQNVGSGNLRIDSMRVQLTTGDASEFQIYVGASYPLIISKGTSYQITLRWSPLSVGPRDGVLIVYSNDPTRSAAQMVIIGTAILVPYLTVADTLSFGSVPTGISSDQNLAIQNTGSGELRIDSMQVESTTGGASEFKVVNAAYPIRIGAGITQSIVVRWSPKTDGPGNSLLSIYSNNWLKSIAQVYLHGVAVTDNIPPTLSNVSVPPIKSPGNAIVIVADVSDAGGIKNFCIEYRIGKGAWQRVDFNLGTTPHSAVIPASAVTTDGIDYCIIASDSSGNTTVWNGTSANEFTPIVITAAADVFSYSTHAGTQQTDYRIFSVPLILADQQASHFFSGKNSLGSSGTEWRLFRYVYPSGYEEWSSANDFNLQPGHAYMLITSKSVTVSNTTGGVASLGSLRVPGIKLSAGWNFIGAAFPYQLALSALELVPPINDLSTSAFYYSGTGSQSGWDFGTSIGFRPWEGFAIHVDDTCLLKLKTPNAAVPTMITPGEEITNSAGGYFRSAGCTADYKTENENEWVGQIIASDEMSIDRITYFGVNSNIAAANNTCRIFEPPAMPNSVSLFFPNPKSTAVSDRLAADIRVSVDKGATWDLELQAAPHTMVRFEMKNLQNIPARLGVFLYDPQRSALYNMRQRTSQDIYSADGTRSLKLIVGEQSYVTHAAEGVGVVPTEYALTQNYPNPFNPLTLIRYQIPEPGHVTLVVYSITGQEAMKLVDSEQSAGYYDVMVNASGLASGVYFYRLSMNGINLTKKLTVIR